MKMELIKVVGMDELVEAVCGTMGDSFATHLEDEETLETAQHEFVVGENDMDVLVGLEHRFFEKPEDFNGVELPIICAPSCYIIAYLRVDGQLVIMDYMGFKTTLIVDPDAEVLEWSKTLPYQELLWLPDVADESECEACKIETEDAE